MKIISMKNKNMKIMILIIIAMIISIKIKISKILKIKYQDKIQLIINNLIQVREWIMIILTIKKLISIITIN